VKSPADAKSGHLRRLGRLLWSPFRGGRKWLLLLALLLVPSTWTEFQRGPGPALELPGEIPAGLHRVYVWHNGYHATLIIENRGRLALGTPEQPRPAWLEYAWGDRSFYMESKFWPWDLAGTAFWPTESVLYLRSRRSAPPPDARLLKLDAPSLRGLLVSLEGSICRAGGERAAPHPRVEGYAGRFYPSRGRYIWSSNCNRWIVDRLRDAGRARKSFGVLIPHQIGALLS
jgi:Protein of unknown function (DUF2459)